MANKVKERRFRISAFTFSAFKKALLEHYSEPLENSFHKFRNGLIYFTVGFIIIFTAHANVEPDSLQLEIITLFGLAMIAIGFFIAMMAQIRMIISRILLFIRKK